MLGAARATARTVIMQWGVLGLLLLGRAAWAAGPGAAVPPAPRTPEETAVLRANNLERTLATVLEGRAADQKNVAAQMATAELRARNLEVQLESVLKERKLEQAQLEKLRSERLYLDQEIAALNLQEQMKEELIAGLYRQAPRYPAFKPGPAIQAGFQPLEELVLRKYVFPNPGGSPTYYGTDISGGDFDGDGLGDVLVGKHIQFRNVKHTYVVLSSLATPSTTVCRVSPENSILFSSRDMYDVHFGDDVDGDGRQDFVLGNRGQLVLSSLLPPIQRGAPAYDVDGSPQVVPGIKILHDLDGDGCAEVLQERDGKVGVLSIKKLLPADGKAALRDRVSGAPFLHPLTTGENHGIADVDYYGLPDLDGDRLGEIAFLAKDDSFQILFSKSGFQEEGQLKIEMPALARTIALRISGIGDFDGDGRSDFWIQDANRYTLHLVTAQAVDAHRRPTAVRVKVSDIESCTVTCHFPGRSMPQGLTGFAKKAADYDGDGLADLVFADAWLFEGRGACFLISGQMVKKARAIDCREPGVQRRMLLGPGHNSCLGPMEITGHLDYSGDRRPDVLISADWDNEGGLGAGAAYVLDGHKIAELLRKPAEARAREAVKEPGRKRRARR